MRKTALLRKFDSVQDRIRVFGDIDHTYSTSQFLEGTFKAQFRAPQDDEKNQDWWEPPLLIAHRGPALAHIHEHFQNAADIDDLALPTDLVVRRRALNKSIGNLVVIPEATRNVQECRPKEQSILLPYLTDSRTVDQLERRSEAKKIELAGFVELQNNGSQPPAADPALGIIDLAADPAEEYRYFCREQNQFFIHTVPNDEVAAMQTGRVGNAITRLALYDAPGPGVAGDLPLWVQANVADHGLHGIPFKKVHALHRTYYNLELENWKIQVQWEAFGQITVDANHNRFEFAFPAGASLSLAFLENGRAVTSSFGGEADTDSFHVFQIWDKGVAGGNAAHFGDMVRPPAANGALQQSYVDGLAAGGFPIVAGGAIALYMYIPKRRYSRGTAYAEPYTQITRNFSPKKLIDINAALSAFERHNATLAWQLRSDAQIGVAGLHQNQHIFHTQRTLEDRLVKYGQPNYNGYGQVQPVFTVAGGNANARDRNYIHSHMTVTGKMATWLAAIRASALPNAQIYSFVVRYRKLATQALGVWPNIPDENDDYTRHEMIVFKKGDIVLVQNQVCLSDTAWKVPFNMGHFLPGTAVHTAIGLWDGVQGGLGNPLLGHADFLKVQTTVEQDSNFRDQTKNPQALADAIPDTLRPVVAAGSPLLLYNFSVADHYYNQDVAHGIPPPAAYYIPLDGGGLPTVLAAGPPIVYAYTLPVMPPSLRTAAQSLALELALAHPVNAGHSNSRAQTLVDALTGDVLFLEDVDNHYRAGPLPIVRTNPTEEITLKEPLLGFYGMSPYNPSSIYPILKQFPPFLQDFVYNFRRNAVTYNVAKLEGSNAGHWDVNVGLVPSGTMQLTMESYNVFDQREKELERVDLPWVRYNLFESVTPYSDAMFDKDIPVLQKSVPTVRCRTIRGKPDFVFVYLEHVVKSGGKSNLRNPVIQGLRLDILGRELKCISSLDEDGLYLATRRNSHVQADVLANYKEIGGVLLSRTDCGDFIQFSELEGTDLFDCTISVTQCEYVHEDYVVEREVVGQNPAEFALTRELDIRMNVLFLYSEYSLSGKQHDATFWFK